LVEGAERQAREGLRREPRLRLEKRLCKDGKMRRVKRLRTREEVLDDFLRRTKPVDIRKCWEYLGPRSPKNYGLFPYNRLTWKVHRFAYVFFIGPIPSGTEVCHTCDNPPCANPLHLFAASHARNMQDASEKCRLCHGESHRSATVTAKIVGRIRQQYDNGVTIKELTRMFQRSGNCIFKIVHRMTWKHVQSESVAALKDL